MVITEKRGNLLLFLLALLPLMGFWLYGLFDVDEGFYAAVVSEMNRRGEWITPYFNGFPWYEKPALLYWLAKPTVALFGDAVGPRLPGVLCAAACLWLVFWFARKRFDLLTARWSLLILAGSLMFVAYGRMMMTDMPLCLAFTGALLFFWESVEGDARWRWASGACLGVAVFAKGPVAVLLFVPIAAFVYWRESDLRPKFKGGWLLGFLFFCLVIATWYLPAYLKDGQLFVQKFLVEQNLNRFTGGDAAHTLHGITNVVFYLPILLVGMLPWGFWLPAAWPRKSEALPRFLAAWSLIVFLFFTASSAKLPHYILPCIPPLALLLGRYFAQKNRASKHALIWPAAWVFCLCVIANIGFIDYYSLSHQNEAHELIGYIRSQPHGTVIAYELPRRERELGTGKLKIQETSLPSLTFYLNQTVSEAEGVDQASPNGNHTQKTLAEYVTAQRPLWIFTRTGRLSADDLSKLSKEGLRLEKITPVRSEAYEIYRSN